MKRATGIEQLKAWMQRSKMNQREMAAFLGWDETFVSRILRGRRKPGRANSVYLQEKTGIPVESW